MRSLLVAICALSAVTCALGHAGHAHVYPDTPEGMNYIRTAVGTCSTWNPYTIGADSFTVTGDATLYVYLYKNCSDRGASSGVEFDVVVNRNSSAYSSMNISSYLHTAGSCSASMNSSTYYLINPAITNLSVTSNMIFGYTTTLNSSGAAHSAVATNGIVRGIDVDGNRATLSPAGSFALYDKATGKVIACCELNLTPKPDLTPASSWYKQPGATMCLLPPASPPPPPTPPSPKVAAAPTYVTADELRDTQVGLAVGLGVPLAILLVAVIFLTVKLYGRVGDSSYAVNGPTKA